MKKEKIIAQLPYQDPFLFVDEILALDENSITGRYTFLEDAHFYQGHFKNHPVTPGVILIETMAQIGLVSLGISLVTSTGNELSGQVALTECQVDFFTPVYPGETVLVTAEKMYFRFGKLKCKVAMFNELNERVCAGQIAGMIGRLKQNKHE
ncbi:hydroxymyristoyl-ACP dehydratase [Flavobacteriaceae bacterium F08102]|nr:hydroxymyristoyl-ACP dehydratase [Flavobacteriaceae bacterium F08102]